jgi:hypothetical protein
MPREAGFGKGPIEGWAMALLFRVSQGAIHIPEQGLQGGHHAQVLRRP